MIGQKHTPSEARWGSDQSQTAC